MTEENANEKIAELIKTKLQKNLNENMTQKKRKGEIVNTEISGKRKKWRGLGCCRIASGCGSYGKDRRGSGEPADPDTCKNHHNGHISMDD